MHPHLEQVLIVAVPPGPQPDVVSIKVARERADENGHQAVDAALLLDVLDHAESSIAECRVPGQPAKEADPNLATDARGLFWVQCLAS